MQEPIEPEEIVEAEAEPEEVELEDVSEEIEEEEVPNNKVVVNVDVLRVRSGPGTDYEIIHRLSKGKIVEVIEEQNEWLLIKGYRGWIHGGYVYKPSDPSKLYEVFTVKIQPVGYDLAEVAHFVEKATTLYLSDNIIPQFDHPNGIENDNLIETVILNELTNYSYSDSWNISILAGKDVQEAARQIFGPDLKELLHGKITFAYDWVFKEQTYRLVGHGGPVISSGTKVLKVVETEKEFIVDAIHYIRYPVDYPESTDPYVDYLIHYGGELFRLSDAKMSYGDFIEVATVPEKQNFNEIIAEKPDLFPVRRYVLSKEGNGVCYIRQSYLLD